MNVYTQTFPNITNEYEFGVVVLNLSNTNLRKSNVINYNFRCSGKSSNLKSDIRFVVMNFILYNKNMKL